MNVSNLLPKNKFSGLERALKEAKEMNLISCDRRAIHRTKIIIEQVVRKLLVAMKKQSSTFDRLFDRVFNGGSIYEQTKIGKADEFDFDILLKIPEEMRPLLVEADVAGFAQLQLKSFDSFTETDPEMRKSFLEFLDHNGFLLSHKMATSFLQKVFEKALLNFFPDLSIKIDDTTYQILTIRFIEPAITLTIRGPNFYVSVDLVASFVLDGEFWPLNNCRRNPYSSPSDFFLTPARPKDAHIHRDRFWRLSFHLQERQIVFNRHGMKPALRVLKRIRDHFNHTVRSYAIKTIFLWELSQGNPSLDESTPDLWTTPLSCIVVHMLEKYLQYLDRGNIPDFWNRDLNLLCYLSDQELRQYRKDVAGAIEDVRNNSGAEVFFKYLT